MSSVWGIMTRPGTRRAIPPFCRKQPVAPPFRLICPGGVLLLLVAFAGKATACEPTATAPLSGGQWGEWPTESVVVQIKAEGDFGENQERTYRGLIESEGTLWIHLIEVRQPTGQPTFLVVRPIERSRVKSINRLPGPAREELRKRIDQVRRRAEIEAADMEAVLLEPAARDGADGYRFRGNWFDLQSTLDEESTRRFVVRLEQVFAAYRQVLPPRVRPAGIPRLFLLGSSDEYRRHLQQRGLGVTNPAVFLEAENLVLAGLDRARFEAQRSQSRTDLARQSNEYRKLKQSVRDRLERLGRQLRQQGWSDAQARDVLNKARRQAEVELGRGFQQLGTAERENDKAFVRAAHGVLVRLCHESFHAYLQNYVYPRESFSVPPWLDEGLAMLFEQAVVESGSMRLGAPHSEALRRLKADLAAGPKRLSPLLTADRTKFLVPHGASDEASHELYYCSWGVVYYLFFQGQLLGSPLLDEYVARQPVPADPAARFERLARMPLQAFEGTWRKSMLEIR